MDDPYQQPSDPASEERPLRPEEPHWTLAPLYLLFRPRIFFETFALRHIQGLVVIAAWFLGMNAVIDRFETKMMTDGDNPMLVLVRTSWPNWWLFVAILGIFSGALYFAIGGWWYRVRLEWSGAVAPDKALARRVYLLASQVVAVPTVLVSLWDTYRYTTPIEAFNADSWTDFFLLATVFWSVYVSYRGVRTAFTVVRWKAMLWFAILPAMIYGLVLAGLVFAAVMGGFVQQPDLAHPTTVRAELFQLEHPGNWTVDRSDPLDSFETGFSIVPPFADAMIRFYFYAEAMDSRECVDQTRAGLVTEYDQPELVPVEQWGGYPGYGYRGVVLIDGGRFEATMFCSTDEGQPFEVLMLCEEQAFKKIHTGFERIETTFRLLQPITE